MALNRPIPGSPIPTFTLPRVGGGEISFGSEEGRWKVIIVSRGNHCSVCRGYFPVVEQQVQHYREAGIDLVAFSADDLEDATTFVHAAGLVTLPFGYGISVEQMHSLGLYVSERYITNPEYPFEQAKTKPFSEPAVFVVNSSNALALIEVTNSPAMRVELNKLKAAVAFARDNNYPIRGLSEPVAKPKTRPGILFPLTSLPRVGGDQVELLPSPGSWKIVVVYRGSFCPLCKMYLPDLDARVDDLASKGIEIVAISGDDEHDAQAMVSELGLTKLPVGYNLAVEDMHSLGCYVSDRVFGTEVEKTKSFAEPSMFVINSDNIIQMVQISNSPGFRPTVSTLVDTVSFVKDTGYPIRGLHGL